jgi:hypothetical protein
MKITSQLKRVLEPTEIDKFERAVKRDKIIVSTLTKLIEDVTSDLNKPTSLSEISSASWALEKSFTEGGRFYLQQILALIKEK